MRWNNGGVTVDHSPSKEQIAVKASLTELDRRDAGVKQVRLLWDRWTGEITVVVTDRDRGQTLEVPVAPNDALRAFKHPYAYAAALGITCDLGALAVS
jgi:hypothetical protein